MFAAETGQMSVAETEKTSAVETRQVLKSQIRCRASQQQWGLSKARPSLNPGRPKFGRGQKHQIWSEMGREWTVWPETWSK